MSDTHSHSVSFVRETSLPPMAPPSTEQGIVKWGRENLFATWPNAILTVAALYVIYLVLRGVMPWLFNGAWTTSSLAECRQTLNGTVGGCFSVLTERWGQLIYGFKYPTDQLWRPNVAFVLMLVAMAPVLFFDLPRKMLMFTAIYPFLAFWLIWGGAFWLPLLIIFGFVLAYFAYKFVLARYGDSMALLAGFGTLIIWMALGLGLMNTGIERVVGAARMDSRVVELAAQQETLTTQIEALTERRDTLDAQVKDIVIVAKEGEEVDPEIYRASLQEAFPIRRELSSVRRELGNLETDLSNAANLQRQIEELPEVEANLPELRILAEKLRAELPDSVADIQTAEGLETLVTRNRAEKLGIESEDFKAAEAALEANDDVLAAERVIKRTYADAARIGLEPVSSRDLGGYMLNMMLGVTCVSMSIPLGIALALGRQSSMPLIKWICVVFIEFIRGVPLITLLFVANVMLAYFFPPGSGVDLFLRVVIMITMFSAAYIAEVIRGGLAALPKGQYEAADSLGLDYAQSMRLIILPQALKISIPGIVNIAVGLFKDTTLVSVISMFDIVGMIRGPILASTDWNGVYWELWGFACVVFFVVCYGISQYSQWLERRLATDHR